MSWRLRAVGAVIAGALLVSCRGGSYKLDEAPVYDGSRFRLKVARYHESIPLHYEGEVFRVQCASVNTRNSPANPTQEAGWVTLGAGGAIGSRSAVELAHREQAHYKVVDEETLLWINRDFHVSFDACGTFRTWSPASIPRDLIVPVEKPDWCKPRGTVDCWQWDFAGGREPRYERISVEPNGQVSFEVETSALREHTSIRVESDDYGRSWRTSAF